MLNAVNGLAGTDAVGIVSIVDDRSVRLNEPLKLPPLFPSQRMTQILNGVALCIVGDGLAINVGKKSSLLCMPW